MWRKEVVKNTVNWPNEFWDDLWILIQEDISFDPVGCFTYAEDPVGVAECAFDGVGDEHMGTWLNYEKGSALDELVKKHKLNGDVVFSEEGMLDWGYRFIDGERYDLEAILQIAE